jgi:hypothetical protein
MGEGATEMSRKDEYGTDRSNADAADPISAEARADDGARPGQEVSEIRDSIEQTRSDMTETIDELQERLSPSYLKDQVKEQVVEQYRQARDSVREATIGKVEDMVERVSDTMYETRRSMVETVTANPIPSALVGIGLAWLWMNRRDSRASGFRSGDDYRRPRRDGDMSRRYASSGQSRFTGSSGDESWDRYTESTRNLTSRAGDAVSDVAGRVQETASTLAGKAKDKVSGAMDQAQQTAGYVVGQAQHQARHAEQRFNEAMQDNPLAIGAIALALGTAIGLAAPQTRKENEWMGEARDTLMDKAQSVASDAMDKVQEVANSVTDEMAPPSSERSRDQLSGNL